MLRKISGSRSATSDAIPLAEGLRVVRIVGGLVSVQQGVSVGIEHDVIIVVLHFLLVGCKEILESISYRRRDAHPG